ncbi:tRNA lysidine(34) synthetase TilS [Rickettsia endosymbiont of Orchestes rusci]|uniref:tRNA lysidine(34) synthetase TilS n=1 Tax=Rickettsia endosymbiont of Orchestes rusci TaxID=3066250 RepID=UPI0020A095D8|nr:tRNA lysidine(34) synthetase TilS [Rickettsia endosymbiont of Ceutorhynchus assimilis]
MLYKKFQNNISDLIDNFPFSKIAIAVSGGADSTTLLYLTSFWAKKNNIKLFVISVDHNLRKQSKLENDYVKEISDKLGHPHYQLHFDHQNNFSNLQERAREGRYELMTDLCHKLDILILLTAHHEDDYVENFCIRLERKSGIFGLSSNNINWYNNIQIARPLFNVPKSELISYLIANNIKWFEDESNLSDKYQRNVIRKKLAQEKEYIKTDIQLRQVETNELLESKFKPELIAAIAESVKIYEFGFACLNLLEFAKFSFEVRVQLISFLLIIISGNKNSTRFYSIAPILTLIEKATKLKKTLHGCIIKRIENNLLIYREFGKKLPSNITLQNKSVIWDNRFHITKNIKIGERASNDIGEEGLFEYVTNLTLKDYSAIKKYLDIKLLKDLTFGNHIAILFTLPVIKILEKVIAMPHISYYDNERKIFNVSFNPSFISRFTHFC